MKDDAFKQCMLKKGTARQVAWIPVRGAQVGKVLEIKTDAVPDPGWEVVSVGDTVFDKSAVLAAQQASRNQRSSSDI